MSMIILVGVVISFAWLTILTHEAGHVIVMSLFLNKFSVGWDKGDFYVGSDRDFKKLKRWQAISVFVAGIIAGIPTMVILVTLANVAWGFLWAFAFAGLYIIGCQNDITEIWGLIKNDNVF